MAQISTLQREHPPLGVVAGGAVLWAAGSTLVCDVMQFGTMLLLVRLLSPSDYGRMALAQGILGLLSVLSFKTFATHSLQLRDPAEVDWQSHFTAASVLNTATFLVTLAVAGVLAMTRKYAGAALPLAVLSIVFLIEVPAVLRQTMVQVSHDWARTRGLTIAGAVLASCAAIGIALAGGGVWALVAGVLFNATPAAIDLVFCVKWRPIWSWDRHRYRDTIKFGLNRATSAGVLAGRQAAEQAALAGIYGFSVLGVFSRSMGLATLAGGRIGGLASAALYPVITRADCGSERFRRLAGLVLRGVAWTTIPASVFLALGARDIATLLYGLRWAGVIAQLPFAAAQAALGGICSAAYTLLLANNQTRACLAVDFATAGFGIALVFWLVPLGPPVYMTGLAAMYLVILALIFFFLRNSGGLGLSQVGAALAPPLISCTAAAGALFGARRILSGFPLPVRLSFETVLFSFVFAVVLRVAFPRLLREFLEVIPAGRWTARVLALQVTSDSSLEAGIKV